MFYKKEAEDIWFYKIHLKLTKNKYKVNCPRNKTECRDEENQDKWNEQDSHSLKL